MKMRDLLILVAVIVVVIMGVIRISMLIDELRDLSKPTGVSEPAQSPFWFAFEIDPIPPKKDLSDKYNDKTLDPTRTVPGEPARHWEPATPWGLLKGTTIY